MSSDNMVVLPGERCRKARETLGWTTAEAARRMHLSHTYLLALGADDYERLPEATFVKGYLKNYAKLLGLPADEIANTFQQMVNEDAFDKPLELPTLAPPPSLWQKPWVWGALIVLLAVALVALWPSNEGLAPLPGIDSESAMQSGQEPAGSDDTMPADDAPGDQPEAEPMPLDDAQPLTSGQEAESGMPAGEEPAAGFDDTAPEAQPEDQAAPVAEEPQEPQANMLAANGLDRLIVRFSADCWIRVRDARGRTLRQGVQSAGASLQLDGTGPFQLRIGDASAVDSILINGETATMPTTSAGSVVNVTVR
ncbi:MAG: DUF4115 domain-containing protein [Pseudomonadales bacterium]|nr:DUF4115 domain-containing protein [Pseudomonadales bacterium]